MTQRSHSRTAEQSTTFATEQGPATGNPQTPETPEASAETPTGTAVGTTTSALT
ncbi:MAG: hypothetical protein HOQ21_04615, partial [Dermatophilaceae bacterium]|nr:hypothetical protein [Dermatophilaceae bacterium]